MFIRMKRDFPYPVEGQKGVTRTLPASWSGDVDEALGKAAVKAGAAVTQSKSKKPRRTSGGGSSAPPPGDEGGGEGDDGDEGGGAGDEGDHGN